MTAYSFEVVSFRILLEVAQNIIYTGSLTSVIVE